jgi:Carboxypeptidase regulatory-like domain/TonB-dependent Receptor Plug Domain
MMTYGRWTHPAGAGLAALLLSCIHIVGQAPGTGAVDGIIEDPSGFTVQNARILVVSDATRISRTAISNASGAFTVPLLAPGNYSVTVTASGFKQMNSPNVPVTVGETNSLEFKLVVAAENTNIVVKARDELAQTQSSTLGRAIGPETVAALPLSNRNYTQILSLSPGVSVALPDATALGRGSQNVTANGNKTTANNIQFNGVDANNLSQNSVQNAGEEVGVAVPAPDTIQEFKVQTGNYDATYGRGTGANVDVVSKSGTNQFHGTVWEFVRNNIFNANDFFSKLDGQPRPTLKQNIFGAAVGGPIRKRKDFFFVAYQGIRSSNAEGDETTTLLPQLGSDRSAATLGAQFCPNAPGRVAAPYTTQAGGVQVACDGSNINPVAVALLNFKLPNGQLAVPSPQVNLPSDPSQLPVGQSTYAIPAKYNEDQATVDVDEVFSERDQLSGRFFYSRAPTVAAFSPNAATVPGWGTNELDQNTMFVLTETHVFNLNLANVARFGYMRFDGISSVTEPVDTSDLGMESPTGLSGPGVPASGVTINGLFITGDAGTPFQAQTTNSFIWQDVLSLTRGQHSLRMGAEIKRHQVMVDAPFASSGGLNFGTFDDFLLGQSASQNGSPSGFSNILLSSGSSGLFRKDERYIDFATFFQDDVRLTPKLTVTAGLRYEIFGAPVEIHGRLATFDPAIASLTVPTSGSFSGFKVPANFEGPTPTGVVRTPYAGLWPNVFHDLSPRLGFALRLSDRPTVVLRGGYGIYFDRLSAGMVENILTQPPFSTFTFASGSSNGAATLQQPFNPLLLPNSAYPVFVPRIPGGGPTVTTLAGQITDPYTQEYNLNVQFTIGRNFLAEVGYVGTRSLHEAGCNEFNQSLLASPSNPINGETTNTAANVVARVPFEGIGPSSLICQTSYNANYNGLQASLTKRLSHGLQFLASYTWSKTLDQTSGSDGSQDYELWLLTNDQRNPAQAYGLTDFDRASRAVLSLVYDSPDVRSLPRVPRAMLANWKLSGIAVAQSGSPLTIIDENAGTVYGNYPFENRAERPTSNPRTHGSLFSRVLNGYIDRNAFPAAPQAPNGLLPTDTDFGNSSVGFLRGPAQHNIDMAIERSIPITESNTVHVRAEFFNLTNTPQFANPDTILSDPTFGTISSKAANPRIIQFALKYMF